MHGLVDRTMVEAYQSGDVVKARARLRRLISTLGDSYPGAARSLEEGLEETLTVVTLGLPEVLRQSLQTTNLIVRLYLVEKSAFSVVRQTSRNVKRWRSGAMVERWAALGLMEAEKRFRRIKGYRHIPKQRKTGLDKNVVA